MAGRFALNLRPNAVVASGAVAQAAKVRAYPNPAHGQFIIGRPTGRLASAVLLNAIGQQVRTVWHFTQLVGQGLTPEHPDVGRLQRQASRQVMDKAELGTRPV